MNTCTLCRNPIRDIEVHFDWESNGRRIRLHNECCLNFVAMSRVGQYRNNTQCPLCRVRTNITDLTDELDRKEHTLSKLCVTCMAHIFQTCPGCGHFASTYALASAHETECPYA